MIAYTYKNYQKNNLKFNASLSQSVIKLPDKISLHMHVISELVLLNYYMIRNDLFAISLLILLLLSKAQMHK